MKVEYINPFLAGAFTVLETVLGNTPVRGKLTVLPNVFTSQYCNIVCGVTGQVHGQVIYGMSMATADRIASTMLGQPVKTLDVLAASAIGELGNMLSGRGALHLHNAGFTCDITPPTLLRGRDLQISTISIPAIVVPAQLAQGEFFITLGLQSRK